MALIFSDALLPYAIAAVAWTCISHCVWASSQWCGDILAVNYLTRARRSRGGHVPAVLVCPSIRAKLSAYPDDLLSGMARTGGRQSFLAGMVLGCSRSNRSLPSLLVVIVLMGRNGRLAGAAVSLALQAMGVAAVFGGAVLVDYLKQVPIVVSSANQLEPYLYKSLSLRTLTRLVGSGFGLPAWIALTLLVLAGTGRVWVSAAPLHVRIGVVALASVLVSPHLIIYDAVLLALPLLWCGAWVEAGQGPHREYFWPAVYGLFAALWLVMPATVTFGPRGGTVFMVIGILLLVWIFAVVATSTGRSVEQTVAPFSPT
jgi:hypothetical protein